MLTASAKEQAADAERRQHRLDERERLLAEEAERLAERDRRITADRGRPGRAGGLAGRRGRPSSPPPPRRTGAELERVAGLTADAARAELVERSRRQAKREAALLVRDIEADARATAEQRARHIVVDAIQRVASEQTAESVVSVLHLP